MRLNSPLSEKVKFFFTFPNSISISLQPICKPLFIHAGGMTLLDHLPSTRNEAVTEWRCLVCPQQSISSPLLKFNELFSAAFFSLPGDPKLWVLLSSQSVFNVLLQTMIALCHRSFDVLRTERSLLTLFP